MTHLIQLTTFEAMLKFGKKPYDESLLPIAERAQSDRAEQYISRFVDRLAQWGNVRVHMSKYDEMEIVSDKLLTILEALDSKLNTPVRITESIRVGQRNAHKWYSDLNQDALSEKLNMFEWMLALVTYTRFHEQQRKAFLLAKEKMQDEKKATRESARVDKQKAKMRQEIADHEAKIRVIQGKIQRLEARLENFDADRENRIEDTPFM